MTVPQNTPPTKGQQLKQFQEETVNKVLMQVREFEENGSIDLPPDYSPANALKAAWFKLLNTKDRNEKPVLESCSKPSIANALLEMVTQGLNPAKNQCAFVAYGNQLTLQREYFGSIALAKRYNPNVKDIVGEVIYQNDVFKYEIREGRKYLVEHNQPFENLDGPIIGAYATVILESEESYIVPMTKAMIDKAWGQGATKGNSPAHRNFTDQMSIKTVINRACKPYINASDDSEIMVEKQQQNDIPKSANTSVIDLEDTEAEDLTKTPGPEPEIQPLKVKSLDEARTFLVENLGVSPAFVVGDKIHEVAKEQGFKIELQSTGQFAEKPDF